ncbi:MAG: CDP-glycerol--poly(glycerophosphate) glycerophosphotransferase, partial [Actinomycetota bacterium]
VWLPTWGGLSSVPEHAEAVSRLADDANVLVKLHPEFTGYQPDETALLASLPFTAVIDEPIDNVALFSVADTVLADYGGSLFGALYCDLPLVLLDVPGAEQNENMVATSPDLLVRSVLPTVQPGDATGLVEAVRDPALRREQVELRARLRPLLFAPFHGCASEVAAAAIGRLDTLVSMRRRSSVSGVVR